MATRADLTSLIGTNLANGTNITAAEHRAVEQAIVDSSVPYKRGFFILPNLAVTTGALSVSGEIASATASIPFAYMSKIVVVFNTAMLNANYYVRIFVKSNSNIAQQRHDVYTPYFTNTSTTGFDFYVRELYDEPQSLTFYIEVISLD